MKRIFIFFFFTITISTATYAQIVSNVSSRLENGKAAVSFTLQKPWYCTLSYSADGGNTFTRCQSVSGATQNNTTGTKTIYWDYWADGVFYGSFLFKVEAELIEMVFVKGGTFKMGSNDGDNDEKPVHSVTLSDFCIGKYEVTKAQWKAVMGNNSSEFKGNNFPVGSVSWNDVQEFIKKLNQLTGKHYRLPTEAEWEYAARGGNKSKGYKYAGSNTISDVAWYNDNSNDKTHAVGIKQPNELGLYDMSGNVYEWCADWYDEDYYSNSPHNNPQGPSSGADRVPRGGSWYGSAWYCRVAYRRNYIPGYRYNYIGLRLAVSPR